MQINSLFVAISFIIGLLIIKYLRSLDLHEREPFVKMFLVWIIWVAYRWGISLLSYTTAKSPFRPSLKQFFVFMICIVLTARAVGAADKQAYAYTLKVFKRSPAVKPYFENSYGYAVFPTVGKGAFYLGAAYGEGQVYNKNTVTGKSKVFQLSLGFQMGGQAFSEIIFFQDKRAYDEFTSGNFEFDASASVVAITAGARAQASTQGHSAGASAGPTTAVQARTTYRKGMATFIHTKGGLMYEAAIGGQKFSFEPL